MSSTDIKQLYQRWLFELWRGDLAVADEVVTDDFVVHQPRLGAEPSEAVRGPKSVASMVEQAHALFAELEVTLDIGPIVEGDYVAARWTFHGAYRGGLPGATAPPGTRAGFSGIDLLRVRDGRFAEYWVSSDNDHLMAQLS